jgi:hypothetical protein
MYVYTYIYIQTHTRAHARTHTHTHTDVHARDIIDGFVRDSILDEREFAWESQLRFYWIRGEDDLFAKQCTFKTPFGYEYMVLIGRLALHLLLGPKCLINTCINVRYVCLADVAGCVRVLMGVWSLHLSRIGAS